jgi:hypothetical protein
MATELSRPLLHLADPRSVTDLTSRMADIFISHSRRDNEVAAAIGERSREVVVRVDNAGAYRPTIEPASRGHKFRKGAIGGWLR